MVNVSRLLCLAIMAVIPGCSADTAKRTTYETLQNIREMECMKNPSLECGKRESYEDYQHKRKELGTPE